ncbi:KTSC domain-containing protein [Kitasatospora sp. NPDC057223]|uniref:KTSC domain-containing protein n=1 Tax=Kitasatospora sp. NPDC057223 TaxID=3346055 RepID=UPI00362F2BC2
MAQAGGSRTAVESSALRSVGYDAAARLLEIEFVSGAVYAYADVPPAVHRELMEAPSHGRCFGQVVRGRYAYRLLRPPGVAGRRSGAPEDDPGAGGRRRR